MWIFKKCPKCKGDIYAEKDTSGWHMECLQCSYTREQQTILMIKDSKPARGSLFYFPDLEEVTSPSRPQSGTVIYKGTGSR